MKQLTTENWSVSLCSYFTLFFNPELYGELTFFTELTFKIPVQSKAVTLWH